MSKPGAWTDYQEWKRQTEEALADPRVGDRFGEMYTFWLYVVARDGDEVTTLEASGPCIFPDDGEARAYSIAEFRDRFTDSAGPWVLLCDRGRDVAGWLERALGAKEEAKSNS